jgi:hypothetical protein
LPACPSCVSTTAWSRPPDWRGSRSIRDERPRDSFAGFTGTVNAPSRYPLIPCLTR